MPVRFKRSLRVRGGIAFAAFGFALSLLLSAWVYLSTHAGGLRLMDQTLTAELKDYLRRRARDPDSLPQATVTVVGYVLPAPAGAPPPPRELRHLPPGLESVMLGGVPYRLLVQDVSGSRYYMLYNETRQQAQETRFKWLLGSEVLLVTLLASAGGLWLAARIIAPVTVLADRVQALDPRATHPRIAEDFPPDELGSLAQVFDRYLARLGAFIERERAFTADVSHELRTPLSIIRGAAEIQEEDASLTPQQRTRALRVQRAARDMSDITAALLVLAREEQGQANRASLTDLATVVREVLDRCRQLPHGERTVVNLTIDADPRIQADPALVLIVVGNLIRNACQHADHGEVGVHLTDKQLHITDTGPGMSEAELSHIFRRHYKGHNSRGEGIGLSLCKRICDHYGWSITIEGRQGHGTRVQLNFG